MNKMTVTNAQYIADETGLNFSVKATINGEELFVSIDPNNRHYAAILEWAEEDGNEIQAAE